MRSILKFVASTRYLALMPVMGLLVLAAALFLFGGASLISFVVEMTLGAENEANDIIFQIVEFVHFFLIGTVLSVTGIGLFQLFIRPLDLPEWLKIDDIEELELNLVGVVIVIIGVNFLSIVFQPGDTNLLNYGLGYAAAIAALSYFISVRSRAQNAKQGKLDRAELEDQTVEKANLRHDQTGLEPEQRIS